MSRWYLNPFPVSSGFGPLWICAIPELYDSDSKFKVQSSKQGTIPSILKVVYIPDSGWMLLVQNNQNPVLFLLFQGRKEQWMDGWVNGWMDGWMDGCVDV